MIAYDPLVTFLLASLFLAITPGPDNLYVLMQSVVYGYKTGVFITLGLCTGLIMHTAAVALGLTLLLQSSPYILPLLKLFGASYLVYLSWRSYRAAAIEISLQNHEALTTFQSYQRGIILNVSNPKVGLFFLAFLPQFTNIDQGSLVEQTLLLGGVFIAITVIVFTGDCTNCLFIKRFSYRSSGSAKSHAPSDGLCTIGLGPTFSTFYMRMHISQ